MTEAFWEAAARRVLVRPVCRDCGRSFFTPQLACPHCLSLDWSYEPSSGEGVVYSATMVHRAPYPELETPYEVGIVDFDEGWSMLCNLAGGPTPIGTRVKVGWREVGGRVAPMFAAAENAAGGRGPKGGPA